MRYLIFLFLVSTVMGAAGLDNVEPRPDQSPLYSMRAITTSDTALTSSTRTWSSISSSFYQIKPDWDRVSISFLAYGDGDGAGDPVDGTFDYKVFLCRPYGSAKQACSGSATVGTLEASHNPQTQQAVTDSKWVELPTVTSTWRVAVTASGAVNDQGNVNIAVTGEFGIYVEVTSLTNISTLTVFITGYKDVSVISNSESATSSGQLPDGHNVTVDNGPGSAAVEVQMTSAVKTSSMVSVDPWEIVGFATADTGAVADFSAGYGGYLNIEIAFVTAAAHSGGDIGDLEYSYNGVDDWIKFADISLLIAETPATSTINDAAVTAGDTSLTLTDATTGDFDTKGRTWFIQDPVIANSETVKTLSNATHNVELASALTRSHANGSIVYDRVIQIRERIGTDMPYIRAFINNTDADCDIAKRTWKQETSEG